MLLQAGFVARLQGREQRQQRRAHRIGKGVFRLEAGAQPVDGFGDGLEQVLLDLGLDLGGVGSALSGDDLFSPLRLEEV